MANLLDLPDLPAPLQEDEEVILERMLSMTDPKWDRREGSYIYDAQAPVANQLAMQRLYMQNIMRASFASMAEGDDLDRVILNRVPTLSRIEAQPARAEVVITGTPGNLIPFDTIFSTVVLREDEEAIEFEILDQLDHTIPPSGEMMLEVVAIEAGEVGRVPAGAIQLASDVGINTVTNPTPATLGAEEEDDDSYRSRYFAFVSEERGGGNDGDYVAWALGVEGVGKVKVIPLWAGRGTVKVLITTITYEKPTPEVITAVKEKIDPVSGEGRGKGDAPIGATVTVFGSEEFQLNIEATLQLQGISLATATAAFNEKLAVYLEELNQRAWETIDVIDFRVNYSKIGALLIDIEGVMDYSGLTLNGTTANVTVPGDQVVRQGVVTFDE